MKKFKPIRQTNDYGCGVFAVINAINYAYFSYKQCLKQPYDLSDVLKLEKLFGTTEEMGTEEWPMIQYLRKYFYVTIRRRFSKKYLSDWLKRGNQAIILYSYNGPLELHYANIFEYHQRKNGDRYYFGANFWFKKFGNIRWSLSQRIQSRYINSMYQPESVVLYLRWRENDKN